MLDPLSVTVPLSVSTDRKPVQPKRYLLSPSPDHPDDYIMELDYSSMSNFMICPRKAENYSVRGREAARDESALNFGRLFHKLEQHRLLLGWTGEFDQYQAEEVVKHFVEYPPAPTDHRNAEMMRKVMIGYRERYSGDRLDNKVLMFEGHKFVERPFKIPLVTIKVDQTIPYSQNVLLGIETNHQQGLHVNHLHVLYVGKIDSLLTESDMYWVKDDKTSSRGGSEFEEAFRLSLQTRGYCWAAQKIVGKQIAGLQLNAVVVRPPTRTGKGTEYNRRSYFYSQDSLDEWEDDMKAHVESFVRCLVKGFWPQTALSFKSPCPSCDYSENCALPRHQRAADLASELYRDVTWNPMYE
jgi:PD-(D/E)XK nuclease superfamily